jgi:hypothetical protein
VTTTPYIESEVKEPFGGIARRYVFSRGVKGLIRASADSARIVVYLSFADKTDSLMWEPKRVLPLLADFDPQAAPSIDSWALTFPSSVAQEALQALDSVIDGRRFYA